MTQNRIIDGANRTEILYGPYTVPAGKMVTKIDARGKVPCTNCYVTAMRATLKLVSRSYWHNGTKIYFT
jgi:hypothetical protein